MVNSLTLMSPERGEISFLKEFPIWAAAKGRRPYKKSELFGHCIAISVPDPDPYVFGLPDPSLFSI
jgi:hypothetical protein